MIKINFAISIFLFITCVIAQIVYSQESKSDIVKSNQKQCSPFIEGLEFCINSPNNSVKSGEAVILHYSIKNLTEQEITISGGGRGGGGILDLIVSDKNGNKMPTILETLIAKQKKETLSQEESERFISFHFHSGPRSSCFEPDEESQWRWNLSNLYNFKDKGKYYVEIYKKSYPPDEKQSAKTLLGKVEVEIQ